MSPVLDLRLTVCPGCTQLGYTSFDYSEDPVIINDHETRLVYWFSHLEFSHRCGPFFLLWPI